VGCTGSSLGTFASLVRPRGSAVGSWYHCRALLPTLVPATCSLAMRSLCSSQNPKVRCSNTWSRCVPVGTFSGTTPLFQAVFNLGLLGDAVLGVHYHRSIVLIPSEQLKGVTVIGVSVRTQRVKLNNNQR